MEKRRIRELERRGEISTVSPDVPKARDLIDSAEKNAQFVETLELTENSATVVFRELYESIRCLGEARFALLGLKTLSHEIQMDALLDFKDLKETFRLAMLETFREVRHKANYSGYLVKTDQARDILEFWNSCGKEILAQLKRKSR
ncbi:MAG: hypothetical protein V1820_02550 [archaeon]